MTATASGMSGWSQEERQIRNRPPSSHSKVARPRMTASGNRGWVPSVVQLPVSGRSSSSAELPFPGDPVTSVPSAEGDEGAEREARREQPQQGGSGGAQSLGQRHDANTFPDLTTTATFARGRAAGPFRTAPVAASNRLPWHGHAMI